ncbi:YDG domain-containing protein, partial [Mycolicibacterium sp.]|uniref:YDG domain-containing protein n=1 Tax=Mycolicibacterium sp. TaxID=2320850 RepID=UPI0028AD01D7
RVEKVYDGNATVQLVGSDFAVDGVLPGDRVAVTRLTGTYTTAGTAQQIRNVGTGKRVVVDDLTFQADADGRPVYGYSLAQHSVSADLGAITPRPLSVGAITAEDKTYDGTVQAVVSTSGAQFQGLILGDDLQLSATGVFADRHAGADKVVTLTSTYGGADRVNYAITDQPTAMANIAKAPATVTAR